LAIPKSVPSIAHSNAGPVQPLWTIAVRLRRKSARKNPIAELLDDHAFCTRIVNLLEGYCNRPIAEIGSLDLSHYL
jgi:hypothetical protein